MNIKPAFLIFNLFIFIRLSVSAAEPSLDDALYAFQESDFSRARKISQMYLSEPMGRLIYHLCQAHDVNNQNLKEGLSGLEKLYEDKNLDKEIWLEAALSYARVIQISQARQMCPPEYANTDVRKLYEEIIPKASRDIKACQAIIYLAESYFLSPDKEARAEGFKKIEEFLAAYDGPKEYLVPVLLYVERFYIFLEDDYQKSFSHLKEAYEIGITNESTKPIVLFRLGRICDFKLARKDLARDYYKEFLRLYPDKERTPAVQRYLKALDEKGK